MSCGGHDNRPLAERFAEIDLDRLGVFGWQIRLWATVADFARSRGDEWVEQRALREVGLCLVALEEAARWVGVMPERPDPNQAEWDLTIATLDQRGGHQGLAPTAAP